MSNDRKLTKIYIVRHGQTVANAEDLVAGHFDTQLTVKGEAQAKARGEDLKHVHFDAVFSSDLVRARRTAELISVDRQLAVNTLYLLREQSFGDWEGRKGPEVREESKKMIELQQQLANEQKLRFKMNYFFESKDDAAWRMLTFLREVAVVYEGKTLLVVVHGSIMRALLMHLGFATFSELPDGCIENTGYIVLESDGVDFFVKETVGVNKMPKK